MRLIWEEAHKVNVNEWVGKAMEEKGGGQVAFNYHFLANKCTFCSLINKMSNQSLSLEVGELGFQIKV